jgi:ABC-2 type transport system ATP-binding protein
VGAAVNLTGLEKSHGPVRAVAGVDLRIAPGEVVALLGPNGAGKSTTIDMLLGLATPDAGTVRIFGLPPGEAVRRGRVGAMLQLGELLPRVTVREVVHLTAALQGHAAHVDRSLERAGIADLARRRTGKLSGGQAQRVRFAMATVADPDLLVLDEPTAGMDVATRRHFWETMRAEAVAGRTVVFATHYLEEADEHADRIVLLGSGRVVADGSITEVKQLARGHTIRATLPGADTAALEALPGVERVERRGETVVLHCGDSDSALRELLATEPDACHVEVSGADLTDAFLSLTGEEHT